MATNRFLDNMFRRNLEQWIETSLFVNAFPQRAPKYQRFERPVAKFILKNLKNQVEIT